MSSVTIAWVAVLTAFALYWVISRKDAGRKLFVLAVTAFVAITLIGAQLKDGRLTKSTPVLDSDRAELLLRFGTTMKVLETKVYSMADSAGSAVGISGGDGASAGKPPAPQDSKPAPKDRDFHDEAAAALEDGIKDNPDDSLNKVRLAIVLGDSGKPEKRKQGLRIVSEIKARHNAKDSAIGEALARIYSGKAVSEDELSRLSKEFVTYLKPGWYRDAALLRLYKVAGAQDQYLKLSGEIQDRAVRLLTNLIIVLAVGLIATLAGLLICVIQLFVLPRRLGSPEDEQGGANAVPWGYGTVYTVLLFWLATQMLVGGLTHPFIKSMGLMTSGALVAAASTAVLYLVSNGPGLLYMNLLAFKPNGMKFFHGLRLKMRTEKLGPVALVFCGIATWCVAVPAVMVAYLVASKLMGSQGSSNPIIALVLDAARSSNYLATTLFYLTLGVLAPLCEESLFRGFLYRSMRKRFGVGTSLVASASLFAFVHMDIGAVVPLLVLGWLFGFVFERTKSLLPAIVAHGLWNSGTFTLVLLVFGT